MFRKNFKSFREGALEIFSLVDSVYQSLLENFSSDTHEHYEYRMKEPGFYTWARQLEDKELAEEVIGLLVKNLADQGLGQRGPFLASYGWRETHYQTTGGLVWGWSFHGDGHWNFFVRHPHGDPAPADEKWETADSTLRGILSLCGWRE